MAQRIKRTPIGAVAGIIAAVLAAGGFGAWWAFNGHKTSTPPTTTTQTIQPSPHNSTLQPPAAQQTAAVYWLKDTGTNLELVPTPLSVNTQEPNAVLTAAVNQLLTGPAATTSVSSTIPPGTKLRSLKIERDGIHIDLSSEFTSGGGSASMSGRLAQILYTATALDPNAQVWINVEGKKLEYLGGEGLELDQPLTRQKFQEDFTL